MALLFIYLILPFLYFIFVHYAFIKITKYCCKYISNILWRNIFISLCAALGFIIIYTDLIWSSSNYKANKGKNYFSYYSNVDPSRYKKTNIKGHVANDIEVSFSAVLKSEEQHCKKQAKDKYASIIVKYPYAFSGEYSAEIYKEIYDKETNCNYELLYIFVEVYKKSRPGDGSNFGIATIMSGGRYEFVTLVCVEKYSSKKETECRFKENPGERLAPSNSKFTNLNIVVRGEISGLSSGNRKQSIFSDLEKKFQILKASSMK